MTITPPPVARRDSGRHDFPTVSSTVILEAPIIAVRRDMVTMPGGSIVPREIVEHFGAVAIVAVDDDGRILLINQWRQCVRDHLWELPGGLLDVAGEDPWECAQRELAEEGGVTARRWGVLADVVSSPGFCEEAIRIFLAEEIRPAAVGTGADDEEADAQRHWLTRAEVEEMIDEGQIVDGIALSSLLRAFAVADRRGHTRSVDTPFTLRPRALAERRSTGPGTDLKRVPASPTSPPTN